MLLNRKYITYLKTSVYRFLCKIDKRVYLFVFFLVLWRRNLKPPISIGDILRTFLKNKMEILYRPPCSQKCDSLLSVFLIHGL